MKVETRPFEKNCEIKSGYFYMKLNYSYIVIDQFYKKMYTFHTAFYYI